MPYDIEIIELLLYMYVILINLHMYNTYNYKRMLSEFLILKFIIN